MAIVWQRNYQNEHDMHPPDTRVVSVAVALLDYTVTMVRPCLNSSLPWVCSDILITNFFGTETLIHYSNGFKFAEVSSQAGSNTAIG